MVNRVCTPSGKYVSEVIDGKFCRCYIDPSTLFKNGPCPRASHLEDTEGKKSSEKKRIGQQKQKKKTRGK